MSRGICCNSGIALDWNCLTTTRPSLETYYLFYTSRVSHSWNEQWTHYQVWWFHKGSWRLIHIKHCITWDGLINCIAYLGPLSLSLPACLRLGYCEILNPQSHFLSQCFENLLKQLRFLPHTWLGTVSDGSSQQYNAQNSNNWLTCENRSHLFPFIYFLCLLFLFWG